MNLVSLIRKSYITYETIFHGGYIGLYMEFKNDLPDIVVDSIYSDTQHFSKYFKKQKVLLVDAHMEYNEIKDIIHNHNFDEYKPSKHMRALLDTARFFKSPIHIIPSDEFGIDRRVLINSGYTYMKDFINGAFRDTLRISYVKNTKFGIAGRITTAPAVESINDIIDFIYLYNYELIYKPIIK